MSWNVRGLGKAEKRRMVRNVMGSQKVDLILIQETKWKNVTERLVSQVWGSGDFKWVAVESEGSSGGLICIWNPE